MHREIAYFPRDFIYLFHTSMTFPFVLLRFNASENRYGSLDASESSMFVPSTSVAYGTNSLILIPEHSRTYAMHLKCTNSTMCLQVAHPV